MNVVELFSGSGVMSDSFRKRGHRALTFDLYQDADVQEDILKITKERLMSILKKKGFDRVDVVWASPPCTAFSVASIRRNFIDGKPVSEKAFLGIELVKKTVEIISWLQPKYWFIENPRGMLRKLGLLDGFARRTVTYCQYGADYQKPTDIWTNAHHWIPRPACHAGDSCHVAQPRGYRAKKAFGVLGKGVQGLSNAFERGKIPIALCFEIVDVCEGRSHLYQESLSDVLNKGVSKK